MATNRRTNKSSRPSLKRIYVLIMLVFAFWALFHLRPVLIPQTNKPTVEDELRDEVFYDDNGKRIHRSVYEIQQGYKEAKAQNIASFVACKESFEGLKISGCKDYVDSLASIPSEPPARDFDSGKSTAQCEDEIDAKWDPLIKIVSARGDKEYAESIDRKKWTQRNECINYDRIRIGQVIHQPRVKVDDLIDRIHKGFAVSEAEIAEVRREVEVAKKFPDDTARTGYLSQSQILFDLVEGRREKPPLNLNLPCSELKTRKKSLDRTFMELLQGLNQFTDRQGTILNKTGYDAKYAEVMKVSAQKSHVEQSARAINCEL